MYTIVKVLCVKRHLLKDSKEYREKINIVKDIILTLSEYGELNQTSLYSFCGLNISKHKKILDSLERNEIIKREEKLDGKRTVTIFKVTNRGITFCREIIEPYEKLFPRKFKSTNF